ncbi:MAG: hypothetical protein KDA92_20665 [Planctomycetales bacterium]|nr:hypothetical protein [Planctomycetales bacterium]
MSVDTAIFVVPAIWSDSSLGRCLKYCGLLVLSCLLLTGCANDGSQQVYIDNGSDDTLEVEIDNVKVAVVPAGEVQWIRIAPGDHRIYAAAGGRTLFSDVKTIEDSRQSKNFGPIIFNPDGNNRYSTCRIEYGESAVMDFVRESVSGAERRQAEEESGKKLSDEAFAIQTMLKQFEPLPEGKWVKAPLMFRVLVAPPEVVRTRMGSSSRKCLTRISKGQYELLIHMRDKADPGDDDVIVLGGVCSTIADDAFLLPDVVRRATVEGSGATPGNESSRTQYASSDDESAWDDEVEENDGDGDDWGDGEDEVEEGEDEDW